MLFVLALLTCAGALSDECQSKECEADQAVSLLHFSRTGTKLMADHTRTQEALGKANDRVMAMLERAASTGYACDQACLDTIATITDFINAILTDGTTQHDEDQSELDGLATVIAGCGTIAQGKLDGTVNNYKVGMQGKRTTHSDCRGSEAALQVTKNTKCSEYDAHRMNAGNKAPDCVATKLTFAYTSSSDPVLRGEMETCVTSVHAWASVFVVFYQNCKDATDAHTPVRTQCEADQTLFEEYYCAWTQELDGTCDAQDTCMLTVDVLAAQAQQVAVSVGARKADYAAGKRILCFLDVFTTAEDGRQAKLADCRARTYDTPHLDPIYPTPASAVACVRETSEPCVTSWVNTEYVAQLWYNNANPKACIACPSA